MDCHFCGVGSRDQIGGADQVQETLFIYPAVTVHCLMVHESDIYRGATKTKSAEFKKEQSDVSQTFRSFGEPFCFYSKVFSNHLLLLTRCSLILFEVLLLLDRFH